MTGMQIYKGRTLICLCYFGTYCLVFFSSESYCVVHQCFSLSFSTSVRGATCLLQLIDQGIQLSFRIMDFAFDPLVFIWDWSQVWPDFSLMQLIRRQNNKLLIFIRHTLTPIEKKFVLTDWPKHPLSSIFCRHLCTFTGLKLLAFSIFVYWTIW